MTCLQSLSFIAPIDILLNPTKSGSIQPDYRMYYRVIRDGNSIARPGSEYGRAKARYMKLRGPWHRS